MIVIVLIPIRLHNLDAIKNWFVLM